MWCNTFVQLDPIAAGILMAVLLKGEIPRLSRLFRAAMALAGIDGAGARQPLLRNQE